MAVLLSLLCTGVARADPPESGEALKRYVIGGSHRVTLWYNDGGDYCPPPGQLGRTTWDAKGIAHYTRCRATQPTVITDKLITEYEALAPCPAGQNGMMDIVDDDIYISCSSPPKTSAQSQPEERVQLKKYGDLYTVPTSGLQAALHDGYDLATPEDVRQLEQRRANDKALGWLGAGLGMFVLFVVAVWLGSMAGYTGTAATITFVAALLISAIEKSAWPTDALNPYALLGQWVGVGARWLVVIWLARTYIAKRRAKKRASAVPAAATAVVS
ncbi:MAG: hypothetical protein RLZZ450_5430 [Pseudomonadota bacterium]|jgi:hypothetical protein